MQKNYKNKFKLVLGLVVFVCFISMIMFYIVKLKGKAQTQTPIQTTPAKMLEQNSEWQTYINNELNFSVEYPNNWQAIQFSRDLAFFSKSAAITFRPSDIETTNKNWGLVTIEIEDNINNFTVDDFFNNYLCYSNEACALAKEATLITVSGVQGKMIVYAPVGIQSKLAALIYKNKIFIIYIHLDKTFEEVYNTQQKEEIFNKMLNSFKFIDSI